MSSQVFLGGLSWAIDDRQLRENFQTFGDVTDARVINDHETGRSRGFGFVSYATEEEAQNAIQGMDGKELAGHVVHVNLAQKRSSFGGGGRGYGDNSGGDRYPSNDGGY